jgi:hypothetical protein
MTATRKGVAPETIRTRRKRAGPVFALIGDEGVSLREACRRTGCTYSKVQEWLDADELLRDQYARARIDRADVLHERMLRAAEVPELGVIETEGVRDGKGFHEIKKTDAVERARLKVDTYKWVLGRMHPNRFGEVTKIEQSGPGGGPIQMDATVTVNVGEGLARLRSKLAGTE